MLALSGLLSGHSTYTAVYSNFLMTENVPRSLEDDVHRLEKQKSSENDQTDNEAFNIFLFCYSTCT